MAETATAAAKEDTGRKWEQKSLCVCAITLFVCQIIIIIIYIYLEYVLYARSKNEFW